MKMKRQIIFLTFLLVTLTVPAQDHNIRRQPKPAQQTTTKPVAKPSSKPVSKARSSKPSNVSLCPDGNHPHMIDLGLPSGTKWSCCNVGAAKPEAFGGYYAWGETETKSEYSWKTYKHCDGTDKTCHDLGADIAGTKYDVAHVKWGGSWCIPADAQIEELLDNCTDTWTTVNGVNGRKFTSKRNGRSIFLPGAGYFNESGLNDSGGYYSNGTYWSGTQSTSWAAGAGDLSVHYRGYFTSDHGPRYWGQSVRPVSR